MKGASGFGALEVSARISNLVCCVPSREPAPSRVPRRRCNRLGTVVILYAFILLSRSRQSEILILVDKSSAQRSLDRVWAAAKNRYRPESGLDPLVKWSRIPGPLIIRNNQTLDSGCCSHSLKKVHPAPWRLLSSPNLASFRCTYS